MGGRVSRLPHVSGRFSLHHTTTLASPSLSPLAHHPNSHNRISADTDLACRQVSVKGWLRSTNVGVRKGDTVGVGPSPGAGVIQVLQVEIDELKKLADIGVEKLVQLEVDPDVRMAGRDTPFLKRQHVEPCERF